MPTELVDARRRDALDLEPRKRRHVATDSPKDNSNHKQITNASRGQVRKELHYTPDVFFFIKHRPQAFIRNVEQNRGLRLDGIEIENRPEGDTGCGTKIRIESVTGIVIRGSTEIKIENGIPNRVRDRNWNSLRTKPILELKTGPLSVLRVRQIKK
ncbi:hypothetical protein EVAR_42472_1 [Eumeta japonica]|uniref:Uncharacterized protein n=1 Tax=Eumeta variegata TaxID=151549 RepID=A0A4C1XXI4_EUMVA|nr:hypothetical protein EVAR_42472_1 [Eumeta japonica]